MHACSRCDPRYFLRVKVLRAYSSNIVKELDIAVQNITKEPEVNNSIKMEVGIEDCLHIEFEYNKSKSVSLSRSRALSLFFAHL